MTLTNGLVVMTPSSIAYSGTSASINADGSVDFSAVTELRLNGVFTSDYDNYMITWRGTTSVSSGIFARLSVGGVDNSTTSSYTRQYIDVDGATITAARASYSFFASPIASAAVQRAGSTMYLFGPYLAQPTALRSVNAHDASSAYFFDGAFTHNQSTSYDGIYIYPPSGNMTGLLTVAGWVQ
jgi:hypothetical protein